jgi:hypothetical protein
VGNTAIGDTALFNNLSGSHNIAVGRYAGYLTTGSYNTFIGGGVAYNNTTGQYNVAMGGVAFNSNQTGNYNTVMGYQAGKGNGVASYTGTVCMGSEAGLLLQDNSNYNTFIGTSSGYNNTTGQNNTGVGANTLKGNQTGSNNLALGYRAAFSDGAVGNMTGVVALGYQALYKNTADYITSVGFEAGYSNTTGAENTYMGFKAGYSATGAGNVFIGNNTAEDHTTGTYNTLVGSGVNKFGVGGSYNVMLGAASGRGNAGSYNTFMGTNAGYANTTGTNNTFLGYNAGFSNLSGTGNVFIGSQAGLNETGSNKLYISNSNTSNPLIKGDFSTYQVDITNKLTIGSDGTPLTLRRADLGLKYGVNQTFQLYNSSNQYVDYGLISSGIISNTAGTHNGFMTLYVASNGVIAPSMVLRASPTVSARTRVAINALYDVDPTATFSVRGETNNNTTYIFRLANYNDEPLLRVNAGGDALMGYQAGYNLTTTGTNNFLVGYRAGYSLTTGSSNIFLGTNTGYSCVSGTANVFLGANAGYSETGSNKLYIENSNSVTPLIGGDFSTDDVTVNADLHVRSTDAFYFGDETTDGTWRIVRSGTNLVFELRESGSWVTKSTMTP